MEEPVLAAWNNLSSINNQQLTEVLFQLKIYHKKAAQTHGKCLVKQLP